MAHVAPPARHAQNCCPATSNRKERRRIAVQQVFVACNWAKRLKDMRNFAVFSLALEAGRAALYRNAASIESFPKQGPAMKAGQRVRLRAASPIAKRDEMSADAVGTVICSYRVRARPSAPERLDVQFSGKTIMWGVAANEFETVEDSRELA